MEDKHELGKYIQSVRKAEGLTQQELADRMGKAKITITQYEAGRSSVTFDTLKEIAEALGCSVDIRFVKK